MLDSILHALQDGATDHALAQARQWAEANPQELHPQRTLIIVLKQAGRVDEAREVAERAIGMAPEDSDLHFLHAGLLLQDADVPQAHAALQRSVELNPNQLGAYVVQAQLALLRGDHDEAARVLHLAERVDPEHPQVRAAAGMLALRQGDARQALASLSQAAQALPNDPQVHHALGFAYMANGHLAFAEQVFRGLLEKRPQVMPLQLLLVQLVQAQGRPEEALQQARALIDGGHAGPGLQRLAGELALQLGQPEQALEHLRVALSAMPGDLRTVQAALEAWRLKGDPQAARNELDGLLERHPAAVPLWHARIDLDRADGADGSDVVQRWLAVAPEDVAALEARMRMQTEAGMSAEAQATANAILERQPGHAMANIQRLQTLVADDPQAAVVQIDELLAKAAGDDNRRLLLDWRASALEAAGRFDEAVTQWTALHAEIAPQRAPLPASTQAPDEWPEVQVEAQAPGAVFLFGLPGSSLERVLPALMRWFPSFRDDRFGPRPPNDAFQYLDSAGRMAAGEIEGAFAAQSWVAALPARGIDDGVVLDWLPWWDNAYLLALRPHLSGARLLYALRDPRDMLLQWLRGNIVGVPFALQEPRTAARWMADALRGLLAMQQQQLFDVRVMRLDENSPDLARQVLGPALGLDLAEAPLPTAVTSPQPPGHWRQYAGVLDDAFAELKDVAVALGYPAE